MKELAGIFISFWLMLLGFLVLALIELLTGELHPRPPGYKIHD